MLSLIVPTHNRCDSALRLADVLDKQSCSEPMEYIFVLDNCTDNTLPALKKLKLCRTLIIIEVNEKSAAACRNRGAEAATGEYLLFLDDDIMPQKNLLEAHVSALRHDNKKFAYVGPYPFAPEMDVNAISQKDKEWWNYFFEILSDPTHKPIFYDCVTGNFSIDKKAFASVGGFDENISHAGREDNEFGIRLFNHGIYIKFLKDALAYHYPEINSKTHFKKHHSYGCADVYLAGKHPEVFWTLPLWSLNKIDNKYRIIYHLINYIGFESFVSLISNYFDAKVDRLWNKKYYCIFKLITRLNYLFGVLSSLGGFNNLHNFISKWADPKDLPLSRIRIEEVDASKAYCGINGTNEWDKICAIIKFGNKRLGWTEFHRNMDLGSISIFEVKQAISALVPQSELLNFARMNTKIINENDGQYNLNIKGKYDNEDNKKITALVLFDDSVDPVLNSFFQEKDDFIYFNTQGRSLRAVLEEALTLFQSDLACILKPEERIDESFSCTVSDRFINSETSVIVCPVIKYKITTKADELLSILNDFERIKTGKHITINGIDGFRCILKNFNFSVHRFVIKKEVLASIVSILPESVKNLEELSLFIVQYMLLKSMRIVYDPLSFIRTDKSYNVGEIRDMINLNAYYSGQALAGLLANRYINQLWALRQIINITSDRFKKSFLFKNVSFQLKFKYLFEGTSSMLRGLSGSHNKSF